MTTSLPNPRFEIVTDAIPDNRGIMIRHNGSSIDVSVYLHENGSLVVHIDTPGDGTENEHDSIGLAVILDEENLYRNPLADDNDSDDDDWFADA